MKASVEIATIHAATVLCSDYLSYKRELILSKLYKEQEYDSSMENAATAAFNLLQKKFDTLKNNIPANVGY